MKLKMIGLSAVLATILVAPAIAQEYKNITRLGVSAPVCDGGITTREELIAYVNANRDDFVQMIQASSWQGDPNVVIDAIVSGELNEAQIQPGTTFEWMGVRHRSNGQTDVSNNLRWAGDNSVDAYSFSVVDNGMQYNFTIPKICCNLAFLSSEPIAVAPAPAPVPVNEAVAVAEQSPAFYPYAGVFSGYYERNRDDCPPANHHTDGVYLGGLGGIMVPVTDSTLVFAQMGGAGDLDESKYGTFFADIGVNQYITENVFIGGGVGYWDINVHDDDDGTYFVQGGVDTPWTIAGGRMQVFAEGRGFMDKDDFGQNWMALGGLRWVYGKK